MVKKERTSTQEKSDYFVHNSKRAGQIIKLFREEGVSLNSVRAYGRYGKTDEGLKALSQAINELDGEGTLSYLIEKNIESYGAEPTYLALYKAIVKNPYLKTNRQRIEIVKKVRKGYISKPERKPSTGVKITKDKNGIKNYKLKK